MLNLQEILKNYPENLHGFKQNLLREYLQYQILGEIYDIPEGRGLRFIGGTSIRILRNGNRFSEDIDFDNKGLSFEDFEMIIEQLVERLKMQGFEVEYRNIKKGAYHCYLKFPKILFENHLSPLPDQKVLIQIDTHNQGVIYEPEFILINRFDVVQKILTPPMDIILSMKFNALLSRKTLKGIER